MANSQLDVIVISIMKGGLLLICYIAYKNLKKIINKINVIFKDNNNPVGDNSLMAGGISVTETEPEPVNEGSWSRINIIIGGIAILILFVFVAYLYVNRKNI